jgi:hypothetical protein
VRAGLLPVGLGGLLLGLVWPSLLGGLQLGSVVTTVAAVTLVVGGTIGLFRTRHEVLPPAV